MQVLKPFRQSAMTLATLAIAMISTMTSLAAPMIIDIGFLTKQQAKDKYGITMHARANGDAGIKVWLQFKKQGWLENFTYAELELVDERGKHRISAMLRPNAVHHRQDPDVTTVAFSAAADELAHCRFLVVCYGSNEGDVGYYLPVKDFLDLGDPITEK
jgi:hypothetical protein